MQRVRRSALAAALVVLGVLGVAGCRSDPGVAAYVGNTKYTVADVNRIVHDLTAHQVQISDGRLGDLRQLILTDLVFGAVAKRYAAERGMAAPSIDREAAGAELRVSPELRLTQVHAEAAAYQELLIRNAQRVEPSDADLREVYDRAVAAGEAPPGGFEQTKAQIQGLTALGSVLAAKQELTAALARYRVSVNPRFGALEFGLLRLRGNEVFTAVGLPLAAADDAVRSG